jgi:hypothetical protein
MPLWDRGKLGQRRRLRRRVRLCPLFLGAAEPAAAATAASGDGGVFSKSRLLLLGFCFFAFESVFACAFVCAVIGASSGGRLSGGAIGGVSVCGLLTTS